MSKGVYLGPIMDPKYLRDGLSIDKNGRTKCFYKRVNDESKETCIIDPEFYKNNMTLFLLEDEVTAETLIHRELDRQNKRLKEHAKKELFYNVTVSDIEKILKDNAIAYTKISYTKYESELILHQILETNNYDNKKVVIGKVTPKSKGEKRRCELLAEKELCVKDIVKKDLNNKSIMPSAKFYYIKYPDSKNPILYTYQMKDFRWDMERGYLTVE